MKARLILRISAALIIALSLTLAVTAQTNKEATFNVSKGDLLDVSLVFIGVIKFSLKLKNPAIILAKL